MLRRISGFKIGQLRGGWTKLHNKGVQIVFSPHDYCGQLEMGGIRGKHRSNNKSIKNFGWKV
jgi:hypothetical protein